MILLYHWLRGKNTHFFFCENWMVLHLRRFLHFVNVFWLFLNYLPLAWLFIRTKLNPHHPKMFCVKFGWNWPSCSFFLKSMYFCYFIIISLWKRVWFYILTNWNPLHLRMLCAKFLNFVNVFSLNINISPWKRAWPYIIANLKSFHPGMLCAKFDWNGPLEEDENVKSLSILRKGHGPLI